MVWIPEGALVDACQRIRIGTTRPTFVSSAREFLDAMHEAPSLAFTDATGVAQLSHLGSDDVPSPIVAICTKPLPDAVSWFQPNPWLSHVMSASMFEQPALADHLGQLAAMASAPSRRLLDWLDDDITGRRTRIAQASKRTERLERMRVFLEGQGVSARTNQQLCETAEEILTNAFYDAPVAAGVVHKPVSRTCDIRLSDEYACDLAYGCRSDLAVVRVRDPFGSLTRERLVNVITRCAQPGMSVEVDEAMGGAGLGMWRVFTNASFVVISVVEHRHTEILVGIYKRKGGPRPYAIHLFFQGGEGRRSWQSHERTTGAGTDLDQSMLLELQAR